MIAHLIHMRVAIRSFDALSFSLLFPLLFFFFFELFFFLRLENQCCGTYGAHSFFNIYFFLCFIAALRAVKNCNTTKLFLFFSLPSYSSYSGQDFSRQSSIYRIYAAFQYRSFPSPPIISYVMSNVDYCWCDGHPPRALRHHRLTSLELSGMRSTAVASTKAAASPTVNYTNGPISPSIASSRSQQSGRQTTMFQLSAHLIEMLQTWELDWQSYRL